MSSYRAAACLLFLTCSCPLFSQFGRIGASSNGHTVTIDVGVSPEPVAVPCVTGAAYSGQKVTETVRTLADGTRLANTGGPDERLWRDSNGRVRTERPLFRDPFSRPGGPLQIQLILIQDPVARYEYLIDPFYLIVHRARLKEPSCAGIGPYIPLAQTQRTLRGGIEFVTEPLGTQVISGLPAVGTKTTTTYPAGSRMGNDPPVRDVGEQWLVTQLQVTVLATDTAVDGSVYTVKLKDLSTAEPPAELFQVPPGYQIVDESGPFTIRATLKK